MVHKRFKRRFRRLAKRIKRVVKRVAPIVANIGTGGLAGKFLLKLRSSGAESGFDRIGSIVKKVARAKQSLRSLTAAPTPVTGGQISDNSRKAVARFGIKDSTSGGGRGSSGNVTFKWKD